MSRRRSLSSQLYRATRIVPLTALIAAGVPALARASVSPGMTAQQAYQQSSACLTRQGFRVVSYPGHGRMAWWGPKSHYQYGSWVYITFNGRIPPKSEVDGPLTVDGLHARQRRIFTPCVAVT